MIDTNLAERDKRYNESFLKRISNKLLVGILKLISYLPFWFIYGISDIFYLLIRYVFKYRKKVILENLTFAFPEKSEKEINQIAGKFYRHFCDISLEAIKMYSMSKKEMAKRVSFSGVHHADKYHIQNKSVIILAMHYNNWEWCSYSQAATKHQVLMVYNPLRGNQAMEKFLLDSREKWGGISIPVHKSARAVFEYAAKNQTTALWLAADQTPPANSKFWTLFLNREAPFFSGPEKISKKTNQPVFFHHTRKLKRGYYEIEVTPLVENPVEVDEKEILLRYIKKMEEIVREKPEFYLWSHRRWKHKRPAEIPLTL